MKKPILYLLLFLLLYIGNLYFFTENYSFDIFTAGHNSALLSTPKMPSQAFDPLPLKTGKEEDMSQSTKTLAQTPPPATPAIPPAGDSFDDIDDTLANIPEIPAKITIPNASPSQDKNFTKEIKTVQSDTNSPSLMPSNSGINTQEAAVAEANYAQQPAQVKTTLAQTERELAPVQELGANINTQQAQNLINAMEKGLPSPSIEQNIQSQSATTLTPTQAEALAKNILSPTLAQAEVLLNKENLVNVESLPIKVFLDIRYATSNNFAGERFYDSPKCYLKKPVAQALEKAAIDALKQETPFYFCIYDCYRPSSVQKIMWAKTKQSPFLASPESGSNHSRGGAIDLGPCDSFGYALPMPTDFDEFSPKAGAYSENKTIPPIAIKNRTMLQKVMRNAGFTTIRKEWWHFDYKDTKKYPLLDLPFN